MVDAGVDIIILETFQQLSEMRIALNLVKRMFDGPVIASMAFTDEPAATNHYGPGKVMRVSGFGFRVSGFGFQGPVIATAEQSNDISARALEP